MGRKQTLPTHNVLIQIHRWSNCRYLVMDYSEAGRNVLADLVTKWGGQWWEHGVNVMDCLHQEPGYEEDRGCLYVGGWQAAENLDLLREKKITHVVNCTTDLQCPHQDHLSYYTFDISWWRRYIHDDIKNLPNFLCPMLTFIEDCFTGGGSVLVHCLMGAHRAGTTGVICVMHFRGLNRSEALQHAFSKRSLIDPIGDFPNLLILCAELKRDT